MTIDDLEDDDEGLAEFVRLFRQASPRGQRIVRTILRTGILSKTYPPDVVPTPDIGLPEVVEAIEAIARARRSLSARSVGPDAPLIARLRQ